MKAYKKNKTMEMLGKQFPMEIFDDQSRKELREIVKARTEKILDIIDLLAMDSFVLGYIYGKRAERSKRKKK